MKDLYNIVGKKIGKWTVLDTAEKRNGILYYICQCECGDIHLVRGCNLIRNESKSCVRCASRARFGYVETIEPYLKNRPKLGINKEPKTNKKSLIGQRFGKFVVLEDTGKRYYGYVVYKCKCDCGNIFEAPSHNIKAGQIKSCGCLSRELKDSWPDRLKKTNKYEFGKFGTGYTQKGEKFFFDTEDYDKLQNYCWRYVSNILVAYIRGAGKTSHNTATAWRIILNENDKDKHVRFKNGNYWDLRKKNLELV